MNFVVSVLYSLLLIYSPCKPANLLNHSEEFFPHVPTLVCMKSFSQLMRSGTLPQNKACVSQFQFASSAARRLTAWT
ncbi:hypothetical protein Y1Q_0020458 [Alligator mississippiensis]|uniref:Secreted protein n=1 Tax=Alligator mississippiensis TaxID=8496 RepID=A0A151P1J5_ALLMI|nr:hypothetical protein Y1Q_0020458 [Alligator mississippiensis]